MGCLDRSCSTVTREAENTFLGCRQAEVGKKEYQAGPASLEHSIGAQVARTRRQIHERSWDIGSLLTHQQSSVRPRVHDVHAGRTTERCSLDCGQSLELTKGLCGLEKWRGQSSTGFFHTAGSHVVRGRR